MHDFALYKNAVFTGFLMLSQYRWRPEKMCTNNIKQSFNLLRRSFGQPIGDFAILKMYPNPVATKLKIQLQLPENTTPDILITNALGQIVYQKTITIKDISTPLFIVDVENFQSGMYFLSLRTTGFEVTKKFIVVRK